MILDVFLISIKVQTQSSFKLIKTKNCSMYSVDHNDILLDFSLTVKAATLIFVSGRCSAISSAKQGKSGSIYNLVKNK